MLGLQIKMSVEYSKKNLFKLKFSNHLDNWYVFFDVFEVIY